MFQHGYDSYLQHAWPAAEVHPVTCTPGTFDLVRLDGLTVVDALDTLLVLGNATEFARAVERLRPLNIVKDVDQNVSVFETNIRVLGGLLSAHQLALAMGLDDPQGASSSLQYRIPRRHVMDEQEQVLWGPVPIDEPDAVCEAAGMETDENSGGDQSSDLDTAAAAPPIPVAPCDKESLSLQDCATVVHPPQRSSTTKTAASSSRAKNHTKVDDTLYWKYDGLLLDLALELGERLLPAFQTPTGIPYGTINLRYGVPRGETTVASLAGGGTLTLEMELLSRLTGDDRFGKAAKLSARALFLKRSKIDLFGKHIDIGLGLWTETLSGIGSNSDSYLEYLAKHYFLFPEDEDFWTMFTIAYAGVFDESRLGEWYVDTDMGSGIKSGGGARRVLESLAAFYPGLQVLLGEVTPAARSLNSFFMVREVLGFLPERFNYGIWNLDLQRDGAGKHPLRPELLESCYFMHRATKGMKADAASSSTGWQWANDFALHKLESVTRTECGYAGLREVKPQTTGSADSSAQGVKLMNEMPSFFLSETLKYLYLTFDEDNILHRDDNRQWIFTTEAHPVHYVPKTKKQKKTSSTANKKTRSSDEDDYDTFADDVEVLKAILKGRAQGHDSHAHGITNSSRSQFKRDLYEEKWTGMIHHSAYHDEMKKLGKLSVLRRSQKSSRSPVDEDSLELGAPFVPSGFVVDVFGEVGGQKNAAHRAFKDHGSGPHLRKACPNVYSSDLLWMQALSGGATDYSDIYVSVTSDSLTDHPIQFTLLGAVDALGAQGTGIYFGEKDLQEKFCKIADMPPQSAESSVSQSQGGAGFTQVAEDENGENVYTFPSDLGNFEISTFTDGTGFHVYRVDSGERMAANFIFDESDETEHIAMIYTELRNGLNELAEGDAGMSDDADTYDNVDEESSSRSAGRMRRSLSITDFEDNAYSCEISLFSKQFGPFGGENNDEDDRTGKELLASLPCSPGLFGPSQISQLREQGDKTVVEAVVLGPREDNSLGCNTPSSASPSHDAASSDDLIPCLVQDEDSSPLDANDNDDEASCENRSIHVVHRGGCAFVSKAKNMEKLWNAVALIVINSEDELFLMSSELPGDNRAGADLADGPLSVLISQSDGETLLKVLHTKTDEHSAVFARISLERHTGAVDEAGTIVNADGDSSPDLIHWPVIRGHGNRLQILAEFGWGIQAVQILADDKQEWQLQLLKHSDTPEHAVRSE